MTDALYFEYFDGFNYVLSTLLIIALTCMHRQAQASCTSNIKCIFELLWRMSCFIACEVETHDKFLL